MSISHRRAADNEKYLVRGVKILGWWRGRAPPRQTRGQLSVARRLGAHLVTSDPPAKYLFWPLCNWPISIRSLPIINYPIRVNWDSLDCLDNEKYLVRGVKILDDVYKHWGSNEKLRDSVVLILPKRILERLLGKPLKHCSNDNCSCIKPLHWIVWTGQNATC